MLQKVIRFITVSYTHLDVYKRQMHIWINLLDNAIKFSPSKGTITRFLKQEQDSVKFILEDEGPGIEDDVKSRIFDLCFLYSLMTAFLLVGLDGLLIALSA